MLISSYAVLSTDIADISKGLWPWALMRMSPKNVYVFINPKLNLNLLTF